MFRMIFENMGDRNGDVDCWLQRRVSRAPQPAINKYFQHVLQFKKRERGHPEAVLSLKKVFLDDEEVKWKVRLIKQSHSEEEARKRTENKIVEELLEEAAENPTEIAKYEIMVTKDAERFVREIREFQEGHQRSFDIANGHPIEDDVT